jgi:ABC-type glycerol-3-phosphate transport system substrate-binding protein
MDRGRVGRVVKGPWSRGAMRRTALGVAAAGLLAIAACSGGQSVGGSAGGGTSDSNSPYGFGAAKQDTGAAITVWVDSTRLPFAQAYQKAHPDVKVNIVTYDGDANGSNTFKTKMSLYDRAGSGWPDVIFTADNNAASWGSAQGTGVLAPLSKGLVPAPYLSSFAKGSLGTCTVNGVTYCLRSDLAQDVLWYNKTLMSKFGYTVPTTWEQYQQLADKVAVQHPGYIVGTAGDAWTPEIYMWASQCPANDITGAKSVSVNTSNPNCVKMAKLLDSLIANKTMSTLSLFGPDFSSAEAKGAGNKVLMLPGPAWYGSSVLQGTLKAPKGEFAVAPPLHWQGQPTVTGDVGGGAWWISSHSANLKAAENFIQWVTTNYSYDGTLNPGYPAYVPAAQKWAQATQAAGYYADSIVAPIEQAAGEVWTGWGSGGFSQEAVWAKVVLAGMSQGKTIQSLLPAWQTEIQNEAQVLGYTVTTK